MFVFSAVLVVRVGAGVSVGCALVDGVEVGGRDSVG